MKSMNPKFVVRMGAAILVALPCVVIGYCWEWAIIRGHEPWPGIIGVVIILAVQILASASTLRRAWRLEPEAIDKLADFLLNNGFMLIACIVGGEIMKGERWLSWWGVSVALGIGAGVMLAGRVVRAQVKILHPRWRPPAPAPPEAPPTDIELAQRITTSLNWLKACAIVGGLALGYLLIAAPQGALYDLCSFLLGTPLTLIACLSLLRLYGALRASGSPRFARLLGVGIILALVALSPLALACYDIFT
ncbi:MAG: hypothetical protein WCO56_27010 [Verrucomicrobiota bacterium]